MIDLDYIKASDRIYVQPGNKIRFCSSSRGARCQATDFVADETDKLSVLTE